MTVVKDILTRSYGCAIEAQMVLGREVCGGSNDSSATVDLQVASQTRKSGISQSAQALANRRGDRRAKAFAQAAWS